MFWICISILWLILVSVIFICRFVKKRERNYIGSLRMDQSDPSEPPYLFLELDPDGMQKIHKYKTVSLRVRIENYLPATRK